MVCPDSAGSGPDACIAMHAEKLRHYRDVLPELADEGIVYRPLIWTCWGRPHCDVGPALASMAAAASRRRGGAPPAVLARRAKGLIGIQLWRRAASMVAACIPTIPADDAADLIPVARDRRLDELDHPEAAAGDDSSEPGSDGGQDLGRSVSVPGPALVYGRGPRS